MLSSIISMDKDNYFFARIRKTMELYVSEIEKYIDQINNATDFDVALYYYSNLLVTLKQYCDIFPQPKHMVLDTLKKYANNFYRSAGFEEIWVKLFLKEYTDSMQSDFVVNEIVMNYFPNYKKLNEQISKILTKFPVYQNKVIELGVQKIKTLLFDYEKKQKELEEYLTKLPLPLSQIKSTIITLSLIASELDPMIARHNKLFYHKSLTMPIQYISEHENRIYGRNFGFLNCYKELINEDIKLDILTKFDIVDQELREEYEKIHAKVLTTLEQVSNLNKVASLSKIVLETLKKIDPEFPVFLPRLAELTDMDLNLVEECVKYILRINPDIGKYDGLSQVLILTKENEVAKYIDILLKSFDGRTKKE